MALLETYTFDSSEKVLRINTDKIAGISRDVQSIGFHLICTSITGSGSVTLEEGNTNDETEAVASVIIDPADGSTTAVSQAISTGNYTIKYFEADAIAYLYLRFPATLTGGTCAIYANADFESTDVS